MKTFFFFLVTILPLQKSVALNIVKVSVSNYSENEINICLTTDAVELYYFQSWQYFISGSTITVEVCFIPGFGSAIAHLNNNFQIPIDTMQHQNYRLIVKAYYSFYTFQNLQDSEQGLFSTPVADPVLIRNESFQENIFYPNPTSGKLFFDNEINTIWIFDITGKKTERLFTSNGIVDLSNKSEGLYIIGYFLKSEYKTCRILVRK